uniref:Uncharacterized protein n=1 Tax=Leersia perrieri TaxID=77586 RepID=A0A0D9X973_9ORYZ
MKRKRLNREVTAAVADGDIAAADGEITVANAATGVDRENTAVAHAGVSSSSGDAICNDDVVRSIFARLPARNVVTEFFYDTGTLRYHLLDRNPSRSWRYHGFHVAGAGRRYGNNPVRALAGQKYNDHQYICTCNGVILLAGKEEADDYEPSVGLLLNPAVTDGEREVTDGELSHIGLRLRHKDQNRQATRLQVQTHSKL